MLDDRSKLLLKALVERYIADGQPVGSRTLARAAGLELSPATVRNVMSDLEELGLIASPHTSAGRVPTARGYRLFVDTMLTARRDDMQAVDAMPPATLQGEQPRQVINQAAQLLSSLSHFVGVVRVPKRASVFRHIEFLSLSQRRVLVILVSPDGEVQNHVIHTQTELEQSRLQEAANFLNAHYAGLTLTEVRDRLRTEVESLRGEISSLMLQAVELGSESDAQQDAVVVAGERNLLSVSDFTHDLGQLRRLFDLFEQKTQLMRLLEVSHQADGVRIYIGGDSQGGVPFEDLSVVSAPYTVDGTVVGTLGVIGPQRMPYERMIQIVDITAKLVGNALSQPRQ
ncbi:heat-inducible transcriptional repressor HrcA [Serpentinimonas barnesii]|uniref:heat-inducible transcriptional repressor HrcA n=1 Tax=Serpentinimonas barnesii TaxID=1458427 RepID=UPI000497AC69|nr:heat-inducible transcriptional repressor HrcA [Serpentinimonas barnesii]